MAIAFDTLEYAQRLRQAGFTPEQAERQAAAPAAAMTEALATKRDLHDLEVRLLAVMDTRFSAVETRLSAVEAYFATMDGAIFGQVASGPILGEDRPRSLPQGGGACPSPTRRDSPCRPMRRSAPKCSRSSPSTRR